MLFCNINEAFNITKINDTSTEIIDNSSIGKFVETETRQKPFKKEQPVEKINLTHRSCLSAFFNPDNYNEKLVDCALKHIHKCDLCKKHITKQQIKNQNKNQNKNIPENQKISNYQLQSDIKEDNVEIQYKSIIEKQQQIINSLNNKLENSEDKQENNQNPLLLVHIIIGILLVFDILVRIRKY